MSRSLRSAWILVRGSLWGQFLCHRVSFVAYFLFFLLAVIAASLANLFLFVDMVRIDILLIRLSFDSWGIGGHTPHLIAAYGELAIFLLSM